MPAAEPADVAFDAALLMGAVDTGWRDRIAQRLPDGPPMDLMVLSELPDRQALGPTVTPDPLEQLHS